MSWFLCQARRSEKALEEKEWEAGFGDVSGVSRPAGSKRPGKVPGLFPKAMIKDQRYLSQ